MRQEFLKDAFEGKMLFFSLSKKGETTYAQVKAKLGSLDTFIPSSANVKATLVSIFRQRFPLPLQGGWFVLEDNSHDAIPVYSL